MATMEEGPESSLSGQCSACSKAKFPQLQSARKGHVQCLMASLERAGLVDRRGRYDALAVDEFGATALHHCCRHDQVQCLSVLVKLAHVRECVRARNGATALHDAAATGSLRCLSYLLKNTEHSMEAGDQAGSTPLHWAVQAGREDAVTALLQSERATCTRATKLGITALHIATSKNKLAILKQLVAFCLAHGEQSVIDAQAMSGATAAYFAAQEGHVECLRYLSEVGGADLSLRAKDKMMCLHATAQHGHLDCLQWIVERCGPQSINERGPDNATIAHFAASQGHWDCLEWIIENTSLNGKERDHFGGTPLHDAADNNRIECVRGLVEHGVLTIATDSDNNTALDLAKAAGHHDIVDYLQQHAEKLREQERHRLLAVLRSKQQEEQEKRRNTKLEKQRKKEQEKLQKMQLKLQQEEEKLQQKELKRQKLEAQLESEASAAAAASLGLAEGAAVGGSIAAALDDSGTIALPPKHEEWDKLEDEAHALALQQGADHSGDGDNGTAPNGVDDKLNTSGAVSFRLSEDEQSTTNSGSAAATAAGKRKKKEKKEKSKTLRSLGRWIKRSGDKQEGSGDRRGISRRSSASSAGTDRRPSTPVSQVSLGTPTNSRGDVVHVDEPSSEETLDASESTARPRGYVRKQKTQYETSIRARESHFGRFLQSRAAKQAARRHQGERGAATDGGINLGGVQMVDADDGSDSTDGAIIDTTDRGHQQQQPQHKAAGTTRTSRLTQGLTSIASFLTRGSNARSPVAAGSQPSSAVPSTQASSDNLLGVASASESTVDKSAVTLDSQQSAAREPPPEMATQEVVMAVGEENSTDDDDRTGTFRHDEQNEQLDGRRFTMERDAGATSSLTTGMAVNTQWSRSADGTPGNAKTEKAKTDNQPPASESSAQQTLHESLKVRQLSLAEKMLGADSPVNEVNEPIHAALRHEVTAANDSAAADAQTAPQQGDSTIDARPTIARSTSLEDVLFGGNKERAENRETMEAPPRPTVDIVKKSMARNSLAHHKKKEQLRRSSDQLFADLTSQLHEEDEEGTGTDKKQSIGLEDALFGAQSAEQLASEREIRPRGGSLTTGSGDDSGIDYLEAVLMKAKSKVSEREEAGRMSASQPNLLSADDNLEAALFKASSMERVATRRESGDHLLTAAAAAALVAKSTEELNIDHLLHAAEVGGHRSRNSDYQDGAASSGSGTEPGSKPSSLSAVYLGEDMLPTSRSNRSLTPSAGMELDTIEESAEVGQGAGDASEQSPEDKHRYQLAALQQRAGASATNAASSIAPPEDGMESGRMSARSSSLPTLVESDVEESDPQRPG